MATCLIIGANRGLGLEFVQQYLADGWRVHATCRDPLTADALNTLRGALDVHALDVTDDAGLRAVAANLKGVPINLLIVNAGVIGARSVDPQQVDRALWLETMAVNTVAPLAIAGAFKANLLAGTNPKAVAISSRLGSMSANETGGHYFYRASKAALNAVWHSLGIDWRADGIACFVLHPGWVRTDMGGPDGDIDPAESIGGMRAVIEKLSLAETGRFYNYDGLPLPW